MSASELKFSKSQRNKTVLHYNGYTYNEFSFTKVGQTGDRFRCRDRKCKGKIVITADKEIKCEEAHSHAPDHAQVEAEIVCKNIKERALDTQETSPAIVQRDSICRLD